MSTYLWCPSEDTQINKHTLDYYAAFKRKDLLTWATVWMNVEDVMLSEISPS